MGPAGLACAIVLARDGQRVIVHERRGRVGARFHGDFQGLESWSDGIDVLDELTSAGIRPSFEHHAISRVTAFDGWGGRHEVRSDKPLYYLVRRGSGTDTLDHALFEQAQASGVEVRLSSPIKSTSGPAVVATGPVLANVMAVGYLFETTMPDGQWACFSDRLAPGGYAYLLVRNGQGSDYDSLWRRSLLPAIRQGIGNRLLYAKVGDRGRRAMFRRLAAGDARPMLAKLYRPSLLGRVLYPFARRHGRIPQHDPDCCDNACTCLRCLCGRHINSGAAASRQDPRPLEF